MHRGLLIAIIVVSILSCRVSDAQIRIVSREKIESVNNPTLADGARLDFETLTQQTGLIDESAEGLQYVYRFVNRGDEDIVITDVKSSCSCAEAHFESRRIAVGERDSIVVRYYPRGHIGRFERRLFVYTQLSDKEPSAVLNLIATVDSSTPHAEDYPVAMGALRLKRGEVQFNRSKSAVERIEVLNCSDSPMRITCRQEFLPRGVEFKSEPEAIEAGECGDLVIRYNATEYRGRERLLLMLNGTGTTPMQSSLRVVIGE